MAFETRWSALRATGRRHDTALTIAVIGCLLAVVCVPGVKSQAYQPATIVDAIDAALFLTNFKDALNAAGLLAQFQSPDWNGTVFAPTDQGMQVFYTENNTTLKDLEANNDTLMQFLGFHIVPGLKYFPISTLQQGLTIPTSQGSSLIVDRTTPGVIHIYGQPKDTGVTNFGTIAQYQEIQGGKAVLYVIDKPVLPPNVTFTPVEPQAPRKLLGLL